MATRKSTRRRPAKVTAQEGIKLLRRVRRAPALLTRERIYEAEKKFTSREEQTVRRMALFALTRTGAELIDSIKDDRDAAVAVAQVVGAIRDYKGKIEGLLQLLNCAQMRMVVAVASRTDSDDIIAEAEREDKRERERPQLRIVPAG